MLGPKRYWVPKNVGSKKIVRPKNLVQNFFFGSARYFGSKNNFGSKHFFRSGVEFLYDGWMLVGVYKVIFM